MKQQQLECLKSRPNKKTFIWIWARTVLLFTDIHAPREQTSQNVTPYIPEVHMPT